MSKSIVNARSSGSHIPAAVQLQTYTLECGKCDDKTTIDNAVFVCMNYGKVVCIYSDEHQAKLWLSEANMALKRFEDPDVELTEKELDYCFEKFGFFDDGENDPGVVVMPLNPEFDENKGEWV
jgi:hypothetical protein